MSLTIKQILDEEDEAEDGCIHKTFEDMKIISYYNTFKDFQH